jgi:hypothetical protein
VVRKKNKKKKRGKKEGEEKPKRRVRWKIGLQQNTESVVGSERKYMRALRERSRRLGGGKTHKKDKGERESKRITSMGSIWTSGNDRLTSGSSYSLIRFCSSARKEPRGGMACVYVKE